MGKRNYGNTFHIDCQRGWKECNVCKNKLTLDNFLIDKRFNLFFSRCNKCIQIKFNLYRKERRKRDNAFRLLDATATRIRKVLKGEKKYKNTLKLLGCNANEFKLHIESKFKDDMTWENFGYGENNWHIEHILPCALFDFTDFRQQSICFHYTNLRPMWSKENQAKSDLLPDGRRARDLTKEDKLNYLKSLGFNLS